jgi:tetratricopeptide (TPR) repeat protein
VFRDGEPVDLTGVSVQGVFMPPQGDPIAITSGNIVSGNEAEVVLPQACYNYDGQFCLAIKLVDSNSDILDEPALLHAATLVKDLASKVKLYNKAIDKFDSDKARFNLGCAYLDAGDLKKAAKAFANVETKDEELTNALGVLALREGDFDKATSLFKKAGTKVAKTNQGVIDILSGDYEKAVSDLKDAEGCCNNTVLAYLLTNQYDKALKAAHCKDPQVTYLKAVIAARQGNFDQVKTYLAEVAKKDKALAERALKDVEFAEYYK